MAEAALGTKFTTKGANDVINALDTIKNSMAALDRINASFVKNAAAVNKQFENFNKTAKSAAQNINTFVKSADIASKSTKSASENIKNAGDNVKRTGSEFDKTSKKVGGFSKVIETLNNNFARISQAGNDVANIGQKMIGVLSFPVKEAADFQNKMQAVKAVMADVSEEGFKAMSDEAKRMGATTAATASQAAEALQFLAMAGLDAREATEALSGTLALAQAGNLSMAKAADISTNVLAGLGLEVEELGRVVDVMATAANKSNQSVSELGQAMRIAGPAAKGTNTEMEDMVAFLGGLANAGIKGSNAGHAVKRMLISLLSPTGRAADKLEELNISTEDSEGNFRGLIPILKDLQGRQVDLADATEIFGKYTSTAAIAAAGATNDIEGLQGAFEQASGAAKKMAKTRLDSFLGSLTLLKSAVSGLLISAGEPLLGILAKIAGAATKLIGIIQSVGKFLGPVTPILLAIVGVLGSLLVVMGSTAVALAGMIAAFTTLSGILQGQVATSLFGYVRNLAVVNAGMTVTTTVVGKLKLAFTTLLPVLAAVGAAWGISKIYEAIKAYYSMRDAQKAAKESIQNLVTNSQNLIDKYSEFGAMDFSGKTVNQLVQMQTELKKARVYWIAMKNVAETKKDSEAIADATAKLKELDGMLVQVSQQSALEKPREAIKATKDEMQKFKEAAQDAYDKAIESAKKYTDKALEFTEKIRQANLTTEQKVAEFRRQGLTDEEKRASRQKELEETLAKLKEASANKDYETAERLAKHAESLQVANMQGQDKVTENQIQGYEQIRQAYNDYVLEPQKQANVELAKGASEAAKTIQEQLNAIGDNLTANVRIELSNLQEMEETLDAQFAKIEPEIDLKKPALTALDEALKAIENTDKKVDVPVDADDAEAKRKISELTKTETKIIKVVTQEAKSGGGVAGDSGPLKLSRGFKLPGYSRKDTVPALLTLGERVTNALSTRVIDGFMPGLMDSINRLRTRQDAVNLFSKFMPTIKASQGAFIAARRQPVMRPVLKLADGAKVGGGSTTINNNGLNLDDIKDLGRIMVVTPKEKGSIFGNESILKQLTREMQRQKMAGAF